MFNIDWNYFVRLLMPPHKRKTLRLAWLTLLSYPIRRLSSELNSYRVSTAYIATMRGTVIYLEKLLNDKFNNGASGIYINPYNTKTYIYVSNNNSGAVVYVENNPSTSLQLPDEQFYINLPDFEILIPSGLVIDINQLRAELMVHVFATKSYTIKYY